MANDEGHLLSGTPRGGNDEVPFALAIVVVGDHDDFAVGERLQGRFDHTRHLGRSARWNRRVLALGLVRIVRLAAPLEHSADLNFTIIVNWPERMAGRLIVFPRCSWDDWCPARSAHRTAKDQLGRIGVLVSAPEGARGWRKP